MSQVASNLSTSTAAGDNNNPASRVESPLKQIKFYLDKYKIKDALQIFFNDNTLRLLAEEPDFMWDVIPLICTRLRGLCQYRFRVFEGCERMLYRLAEDENCGAKEVLISLLAEINNTEHREDDNVFRAMIRPLEGALLRMSMPSPREENFRWTLKVLMRHINDTPLPQEYNIEGKKRLSLPNDPSVKRFIETLPLMLSFIEELNVTLDYDKIPMPILTERQIDEVLNGELNSVVHSGQDDDPLGEEDTNRDGGEDDDFIGDDHAPVRSDITDASVTALLRLIQRPFTTLDTTNYCKELRSTSVRCLCLLLRLMPDLMSPIYKQSRKNMHSQGPSQSNNPITDQVFFSPDVAIDLVSSYITPLANQHFDGDVPNAILTIGTCAYLYRCEIKTCPSPQLSPTSSMAAISNLVSPAMPTTPLAIDMTQYFPQILSHDTLFFCHVPYIVTLLNRPEILAHEKGLSLLGNLLTLLSINSQGLNFLEMCRSSSLLSQLFQIMIHSPLSTNRRRAYELFTVICDVLTYDCKFDLFEWSLQRNDLRPCIRAACIDQYRRQLSNIHKELMELHQRIDFVKSLSDSEPHESELQSKIVLPGKLSKAEQMDAINKLLERMTYNEDPLQNPYEFASTEFINESYEQFESIKDQIDTRHENIWLMCRDSLRRIHIWQGRHKILGGHHLTEFLDLCIAACLPEGQHTDIIERNDLILATLTMFRYLKLRKPLVNDDTERDYLASKRLRKRFFNPIRNALSMVKTELKTHLKELDDLKDSAGKQGPANAEAPTPEIGLKSLNSHACSHDKGLIAMNPNVESELIIPNSPMDGTANNKTGVGHNPANELLISDDDDDNDDDDGEDYHLNPGADGYPSGGGGSDAECLNFVLCRLDLVESILVRTCDLYDC